MAETCLNCASQVTENFCGKCGQKKYKRIDRKYIWDELQYTIFHTNKGLLYSVKSTLKNPGKTAREFIEGNRVNHYKPILMVFVLSGISAFVSFKVLNFKEVLSTYFAQQHMNSKLMADMMTFMSSYSSILMLLYIPMFALITKIAFRKWGHNYYEHVVMNAYILSFYTLASIILVYPIMFFFKDAPGVFFKMTQLSILMVPPILFWFFRAFYREKPLKSIILRVLGTLGLTIAFYLVVVILAGIIGVILSLSRGPEALEYIKPK
ncbi:DUF3667 domain-containing protein [Parasegetibacter sp. NRK P23]|uniref:DUF3667 domain-containing protein n=1 Tax=Parasegetibacter sp. NRK P23 TaxID=2942999 RepID=UPI002044AEDE|nr:DUF3667 domain-containing protein [Parasegetibacter sp. NRK P23]MCM5528430.1 DUF3667 domain-containing protein [Parasegetibacter sp. NRK P23]